MKESEKAQKPDEFIYNPESKRYVRRDTYQGRVLAGLVTPPSKPNPHVTFESPQGSEYTELSEPRQNRFQTASQPRVHKGVAVPREQSSHIDKIPSQVTEDPILKEALRKLDEAEWNKIKVEEKKLSDSIRKNRQHHKDTGFFDPSFIDEEELVTSEGLNYLELAHELNLEEPGTIITHLTPGITDVSGLDSNSEVSSGTSLSSGSVVPITPSTYQGEPPTPSIHNNQPSNIDSTEFQSIPESNVNGPENQQHTLPTGPTTATGPSVIEKHPPKYHLVPLLLIFGTNKAPMPWDLELEDNVFKSGLGPSERISYMDMIIKNYGSLIFVTERKSDSLEELNELIQMQYCYVRNLQRGTRTKQAMVPISSLVSFANQLGVGSQPPSTQSPVRNDFVQPLDSVSVQGFAPGTEFPPGDTPMEPIQPPSGNVQPPSGPDVIPIGVNQAQKEVSDAYRNKPTEPHGKYIIDQALVKQNTRRDFSTVIVGPTPQKDPLGIQINYKTTVKPKLVKMQARSYGSSKPV